MKITKYDLLFALYMGIILCASGYKWDSIGIFHKLVMIFCGIGIFGIGYRAGASYMRDKITESITTQVMNAVKKDANPTSSK